MRLLAVSGIFAEALAGEVVASEVFRTIEANTADTFCVPAMTAVRP